MFQYQAFGLRIHSLLPLPELLEAQCVTADVTIRWGRVDPMPAAAAAGKPRCCMRAGLAWLVWDGVAKFAVCKGKEIIVDPFPHVDAQLIRLPLLGMVLAVLLLQRGMVVLHGSAMVVDGVAVAFLGNKGAGKSTLAMALYSAGHNFLADDVVALNLTDPNFAAIYPAFPQFKLWPDAVACSPELQAETWSALHPQMTKQSCRLTDRFLLQPVALKQIYVLGINSKAEIRPLSPQDATIELIRNSYMARFDPLPRTLEAQHLSQCADLTRKVSVYRFTYPSRLSSLPDLTRLVEEHLMFCSYANAV